MDVWFCIEQEQSPRGKNREPKNSKELFTRSSSARQETFFLLTKTYHGSPVLGNCEASCKVCRSRLPHFKDVVHFTFADENLGLRLCLLPALYGRGYLTDC
jgi:hypothetical protein